ncbi:MAG: LysR substrate-binding domain-containing protein [Dongiaceae bacterium]
MDVRRLAQFVAIVEAGSLSRAAERLRLAQPALSHALAALEEELGVPLLHRHSRGVAPTELGAVLLEQARIIVREVERTRELLRHRLEQPAGNVRLGIAPHLAGGLCAPLLARLQDSHPSISLRVVEGGTERLTAGLDLGQIDLAALPGAQFADDLSARPLVIEDLCLVTARGALPGRRRRLVELERFRLALPPPGDLLRTLLDEAAAQYSVRLSAPWEIESVAAALALAEAPGQATVLPAFALCAAGEHRLEALPLAEPKLSWCVFAVRKRGRSLTRAAEAVLDALVAVADELVRARSWRGRFVGHVPTEAAGLRVMGAEDALR